MITYETPTEKAVYDENSCKIFLAGTIDNGDSVNWQQVAKDAIDCQIENPNLNVVVFNPRREHWNFTVNELEQERQIEWEQEHLDKADIILMNLCPDSKSPISLMELGEYANTGKLIVVCPPEFYRYINVKLLCRKFHIPIVSFLDQGLKLVFLRINEFLKNRKVNYEIDRNIR